MKPILKYTPDFLEYCEVEKGLSPSTVKNYANFLRPFSVWMRKNNLAELAPDKFTADHIWKYRVFLSKDVNKATRKLLSKQTQGYYLIALRALLTYFSEKEIPCLSPEKIHLPKQTKERAVKFLSLDQLKKLLDSPDISSKKGVRDRAILETFFSTGLRIAELVSLNVSQFSPQAIKDKNAYELTIVGKGFKPRNIYFSERCLSWIKKYLETRLYDTDPGLFVNLRSPLSNDESESRRLSPRSIERIIKYYAVKAGLPLYVTPHTLRHTYATDLLNQGVDLRAIQEFLGHSSILTTQVYTHVTNKRLREIHKKFHSGNRLGN